MIHRTYGHATGARFFIAPLFVVAAAYFWFGIDRSLDFWDEGQLVYLSWRVSQEAIPFRDFENIYGPSLFYVNGALFKVFGADLFVIRGSLLVLKSIVAVLVYLCARRVGPWPLAFGAFTFTVVIWGLPWPYFTTPYANYYGLAFSLTGLLLFLSLPERLRLGCLLAGACFGLAATFKQTNGIFAFCSLVLYLISRRGVPGPDFTRAPRTALAAIAASVRRLALLGALALFVAYLWPRNTIWNAVVLLSPAAVATAWLAMREMRDPPDPRAQFECLCAMIALSVGMAIPLLSYAGYYQWHGLLPELVYNTVLGLPQKLRWLVPLRALDLNMALWSLALLSGLAFIGLWSRRADRDPRSRVALILVLCVSLASSGALLLNIAVAETHWILQVSDLFVLIPFLLVWSSLAIVFRSIEREAANRSARGDHDAAMLFTLYAATAVLYFYPASDLAHVFMSTPAMLPLLALSLARLRETPARNGERRFPRRGSGALVAALLTLLAIPFVYVLVSTRALEGPPRPLFERASRIEVGGDLYRDSSRLVNYLNADANRRRQVLLVSGKQMIYFLSSRTSPFDQYEYVFYLIGLGLIGGDEARRLVDQRKIVTFMERSRPLVINDSYDAAGSRFARTLPQVWAYIRGHYRPTKRIGKFQILEWLPEADDKADSRNS